jgi:hypothetical protein
LGDPVACDNLQDIQWDQLHQENKGMLLKSLQEFKEQALAGVVSLGTMKQVGGMPALCVA